MAKIIITDNIVNDAVAKGITVDDMLAHVYEGEIQDRIKNDGRLENLSPLKLAMMDVGLSGKSLIKDFSTAGAGEWLLPTFIDTRLRETVAGNSMLGYITNSIVGIDGLTALAATLDLVDDAKNKDAAKKKDVNEGADLPLARFSLGETGLRLRKRGRAVESTYEAIQYLRVDLFAKAIDAIANDVADQQTGDAITVLINGDGNNNAIGLAAETATAGIIVVDDLINSMITFQEKSKLGITTILATDNFFRQLFKMKYNVEEVPGAESRFVLSTPQFSMQNVNLIHDKRVVNTTGGKERAIILNSDEALIKYVANGSNIRELDKNIRNQTQLGTISEIANFGKFNKNAAMEIVSK